MSKARSLYIWEGENNITFTRGFPLETQDNIDYMRKIKIKHKGLLQQFFNVTNIDQKYVGIPKGLFNGMRIMDGWQVVRIKMGFENKEPCLFEIPPSIEVELQILREDRERWKRKYLRLKRIVENMDQKDRSRYSAMDDVKFAADVKSKLFSSDSNWMTPAFGNRWSPSTVPTNTEGSE